MADGAQPHRRGLRERGSVAVEFALLLPLLLLIVCGIIDFGRALNAQITLTQAAREGVRLESLGTATATVQSQTVTAATGLNLSASNVTVVSACTSSSNSTSNAEVQASYSFSFITPVGALASWFSTGHLGSAITLTATGVMPCEI